MKKLQIKVINWATDKEIFDKATPFKQAQKTLEECGELLHAIGAEDKDEVKDAIGDVLVTLIIQAEMQGTTLKECLQGAYDVIKHRTGSIKNGTFIKD